MYVCIHVHETYPYTHKNITRDQRAKRIHSYVNIHIHLYSMYICILYVYMCVCVYMHTRVYIYA